MLAIPSSSSIYLLLSLLYLYLALIVLVFFSYNSACHIIYTEPFKEAEKKRTNVLIYVEGDRLKSHKCQRIWPVKAIRITEPIKAVI